ncbi:hypothetical protein QAD02_023943 [Eretmocerus hayati]|uniref:Uncharacterized protein n=1 Tax=Eretmocerus hayati TaxID=131215 RepID=A0ACC2PXC3_9HYME|nr:hypothetical protein QAD02_023943 [Eretmocerus hayati]
MDSRKRNEALLAAVRGRNRELVLNLIKDGADVDALDYSRGKTCIDTAIDNSDVELVRLLLREGASPNLRRNRYVDAPRRSPLIRAVIAGNCEIIKLLVNAGALMNVTDKRQRNCLHYAAERKTTKAAQALLKAGATVSIINAWDIEKFSPLMIAIQRQNVPMIKLLLESGSFTHYHGRDESLSKDWQADCLHEAIEIGNKDIVRLLLEHGAAITPWNLLLAIDSGPNTSDDIKTDILKMMLLHATEELKADGSIAKWIFRAALKRRNSSAIIFLFENCGIEQHKSYLNTLNPLHDVVKSGNRKLLKILLRQSIFDVEKENSCTATPLITAVILDKPRMVKTLLKAGANPNHGTNINSQEVSPLTAAISRKSVASLKLLLDAGVIYDSAFLYITRSSLTSVMECILEYIALHKSQGRLIKPEHLDAIKKSASLQEFFKVCCLELEVMQKSVIHDSVTFYTMLTDSNVKDVVNETLVLKALRSSHILELFPIYGERVLACYAKLWGKQRLMDDAAIGLSRLVGLDSDAFHVILYNILKFLPKADLCQLRHISLT